jgi:hypothetical protein
MEGDSIALTVQEEVRERKKRLTTGCNGLFKPP